MDEGAATLISFIVVVIFMIVFCIFNGFRSAAEHFNSIDVEEIEDEEMKQKIDAILDEDASIRRTYLIYTTVYLIVVGIVSAVHFRVFVISKLQLATTLANLVALIVFYILVVIIVATFGVFIPIKLGERKAEKWLTKYVGFINGIMIVLKPLTFLVNGIADFLLPVFKADPRQVVDEIDEDEIISMIDESHEQGKILESEAEMIHNIFEFDDKDAADVMTPRLNIVALDATMKFEEAFDYMLQENFSRFPVYTEDIDHIVGTVHIKDAMLFYRQKEYLIREIQSVPGLVREIDTVPETQTINHLLRQMQKTKEHMAAVVDEYGQTAGIITLEDILEEIVGEIEDEHDEDVAMIVGQTNGNYLLNGMALLEDVAENLHITFDTEDINTLNGFLISLFDKIPEDNESLETDYQGYHFKVLSVADKMIKTVLAIPIAEPDCEEKDETR